MKDRPLFSVLVANFNNASFIDEAIRSVLNQTYSNWEVIIVDDASTDHSFQVLKKFQHDERIKIFYNDRNSGAGFTKRKCVELSNGEIAGFLDSDDALCENAIEVMVEAHLSNSNCCLIYSKFIFCDVELNEEDYSNYAIQIPPESSYLKQNTGRISHFATFKVSFYKLTEGINASYKRAVDQSLYLVLEESGGELLFIDRFLYKYRRNPNGVSRQSSHLAFTWNIIAKIDACRRRGICIEEVIPDFIPDIRKIMFEHKNSKDYRIGKMILSPIRIFRRLIDRNLHE
jgi:glycosyltransferase involved in cell wall biosynthesis